MKDNEYKCAVCSGEFEKGWSEEEAVAEMKNNFGEDSTTDDCSIVCDDCYKKMGFE